MKQEVLTVFEAAKLAGMNPEVVRRRCREGTMPCVNILGRWAFDPDVLARWIAAGKPRTDKL